MLGVVGADADRVQLLVVEQGLVVRVEAAAFDAVARGELLGLAGNQVRHGHDLDVLHALVGLNVRFRNPARADDADLELVFIAHFDFFFDHGLLKLVEYLVSLFCHENNPLLLLRYVPLYA